MAPSAWHRRGLSDEKKVSNWNRQKLFVSIALVPDSRKRELEEAMATYQKLIANYTLTRERLIERRRGAADHVMIEIDQRLEVNARTIAALGRAVEMSREHLTLIYPREASENVEGAGGI